MEDWRPATPAPTDLSPLGGLDGPEGPGDPPAWVAANMPRSYLRRVGCSPGLLRVHLRAIAGFSGPDSNCTTTVLRQNLQNGFTISVLDTQASPGSLLHTVPNTLPQTDTMMHSIDVFCSLDDTLSLSVYHYCHDRHSLERPGDADAAEVARFAAEAKLGRHAPDLTPLPADRQAQLGGWLRRCPNHFVQSVCASHMHRLFLLDCSARQTGQPEVAWFADPAHAGLDLPLRLDSSLKQSPTAARRTQKRCQLAASVWVYGSVPSVPNIKVFQIACRVLLAFKLNIEQAHADTTWEELGKPAVLFRFLVCGPAGKVAGTGAVAQRAVAALRPALAAAYAEATAQHPASPERRTPPRALSKSSSFLTDDSSLSVSSEGSSDGGSCEPTSLPEPSGYLSKQQRHGVLRLWQKRWVQLRGPILSYSKSRASPVSKTLDVRHLHAALSAAHCHAISLSEPDGRVILRLAGHTSQECAKWLEAIQAAQNHSPTDPGAGLTAKETEWDMEVALQRYQRLRCLGRGSVGKVWKVLDRETGDILAVKVMSKDQVVRQRLESVVMAEKAILQRLQHPFVVGLHASFETPTKLCLVLDYHSGGTLLELLQKWTRLPPAAARFYAVEVALALKYLHSEHVIHRDLKTSNVLLTGSGHAVLADFGIASGCREATTFCGTPDYLAPEVVSHRTYTAAIDWWCYGVALYHMLTGSLPFVSLGSNGGGTIYRNILSEEPDYSPALLSPEATSLLQGLLQKDPDRRISFDQLTAEPFFAAVDWDAALQLKVPSPYLPDGSPLGTPPRRPSQPSPLRCAPQSAPL